MTDGVCFRVTAEGEVEQKKKKKDEDKKVKKGRERKISDVSDEDADGGGWEAVKGGIATMVVSDKLLLSVPWIQCGFLECLSCKTNRGAANSSMSSCVVTINNTLMSSTCMQ